MPERSLAGGEIPPAQMLAEEWFERPTPPMVRPDPWALPFLIDTALGRFPDFPWVLEVRGPGERREGQLPSDFAQYLAYAPVIPFESSPLANRSLAEILTTSGGTATAAAGYYATGDLLVVLAVPVGIIVLGAAQGVSEGLRIGLRSKVLAFMGVEDPDRHEGGGPPETPPPTPPAE